MDLNVLQTIEEADMVLVGIGEEFDNLKVLKQNEEYNQKAQLLEATQRKWLLPLLNQQYMPDETQTKVQSALEKLAEILKEKNYFVVTTAMNPVVSKIAWKDNRLVAPCGGYDRKQCACEGAEGVQDTTEAELKAAIKALDCLGQQEENKECLGVCPNCGKPFVFNNIYAPQYNESGYLKQWDLYTKWLQGTLNKKLVVLELGVNMQFPSVIRFPFEKVSYFNQKAHMYRVNEKLYFLSEELKDKGTPISENAMDWLLKE